MIIDWFNIEYQTEIFGLEIFVTRIPKSIVVLSGLHQFCLKYPYIPASNHYYQERNQGY